MSPQKGTESGNFPEETVVGVDCTASKYPLFALYFHSAPDGRQSCGGTLSVQLNQQQLLEPQQQLSTLFISLVSAPGGQTPPTSDGPTNNPPGQAVLQNP